MRPENKLNRRYIKAKIEQVYAGEGWVVEPRASSELRDLGELHK